MSPNRQEFAQTRAKKSLGQNFLIDPNVARKIVSCLQFQPTDRILEIGPGRGALSEILLKSGAQVVGVEKDLNLALELKKKYPVMDLIAADALVLAWQGLHRTGIQKVIGNLPYNVASPLIWDVTAQFAEATCMVLTVQKEVGSRLTASPGTKEYGALSVWVQNFVQPRMEFVLGPSVFRPRPRVDSAVVSFSPRVYPPSAEEGYALARLLRICFQQRRKQLKTSLRSLWSDNVQAWFADQGLQTQARAEELSPGQFMSLARTLGAGGQE